MVGSAVSFLTGLDADEGLESVEVWGDNTRRRWKTRCDDVLGHGSGNSSGGVVLLAMNREASKGLGESSFAMFNASFSPEETRCYGEGDITIL